MVILRKSHSKGGEAFKKRKLEAGLVFLAGFSIVSIVVALFFIVLFDIASTRSACGRVATINRFALASSSFSYSPPTPEVLPQEKAVWAAGGRDGLLALPLNLVKRSQGAEALCLAAMGLHTAAVDRFLATPGVEASAVLASDHLRTPLHCLGCVWALGDSYPDSYLISLLQDTPHWLDHVPLDPPVTRLARSESYGMRQVMAGADPIVKSIGHRLLKAGADPNAVDEFGFTPLHYACMGSGLDSLVQLLVEAQADTNAVNKFHRQTPLHLCALFGHAHLLALLLENGGGPDLADRYGNTARDIATASGSSTSAADLERFLPPDWGKVPARVLPFESAEAMEWVHGGGGWSTQQKQGNAVLDHTLEEQEANRCDIDVLDVSKEDPTQVFQKYLMMNRPVLLRGLNEKSPAWQHFSKHALEHDSRNVQIETSDIPYSSKFGGTNGQIEALGDFVAHMSNPRVVGTGQANETHRPWYTFLPKSQSGQLVTPDSFPLDPFMRAFLTASKEERSRGFAPGSPRGNPAANLREDVSLQWGLGAAGSGAQIHFHNTAWSQLFYGRKRWYLVSPRDTMMGKKQVLNWVEENLPAFKASGGAGNEQVEVLECTQRQGDSMVVPEYWGHAVLNLQDSVSIASEFHVVQYRIVTPHAYKDLSSGMGMDFYHNSFQPPPATKATKADSNSNQGGEGGGGGGVEQGGAGSADLAAVTGPPEEKKGRELSSQEFEKDARTSSSSFRHRDDRDRERREEVLRAAEEAQNRRRSQPSGARVGGSLRRLQEGEK